MKTEIKSDTYKLFYCGMTLSKEGFAWRQYQEIPCTKTEDNVFEKINGGYAEKWGLNNLLKVNTMASNTIGEDPSRYTNALSCDIIFLEGNEEEAKELCKIFLRERVQYLQSLLDELDQ